MDKQRTKKSIQVKVIFNSADAIEAERTIQRIKQYFHHFKKRCVLQAKKKLIYGGTSSKRPVTSILRKQIVSKSFEGTEKTMKLL